MSNKFRELYNNKDVPAVFRKAFDDGKMTVAEFESGAEKLLDELEDKRIAFGNELVKSEIMQLKVGEIKLIN